MRMPLLLMSIAVPLTWLTIAGCSGTTAPTPPTVTTASVTPTELRFTGGSVSIAVTVKTIVQLQQVRAAVTGPAGTEKIPLALEGTQYVGSLAVPPNEGTEVVVYSVAVWATNTAGQTSPTYFAGEFTVQPATAPPDAPFG